MADIVSLERDDVIHTFTEFDYYLTYYASSYFFKIIIESSTKISSESLSVMLNVVLISFGKTIRPNGSIGLTIPVDFKSIPPLQIKQLKQLKQCQKMLDSILIIPFFGNFVN